MKSEADLVLSGSKRQEDLSMPTFTLKPGWNLIGIYSDEIRTIQETFEGISYSDVYSYDPNTEIYNKAPDDQFTLEPQKGYWVEITEEEDVITRPQITTSGDTNV